MKISLTAVMMLLGSKLFAAGAVEIIEPRDLFTKLDKYVVLDAREKDFESGHIPGSYNFDWKDFTVERPEFGSLFRPKDTSNFGKVSVSPLVLDRLNEIGLNNDSKVVVVGVPRTWGTEGRIAWNLLYWGLNKVYLLNGGIDAWKKASFPLEKGKARQHEPPISGKFAFNLSTDRRIEKIPLRDKMTKVMLMDIRSKEEFSGALLYGVKRGGHLPGARNVEVLDLYASDGRFIEREDFLRRFPLAGGKYVAYCVGGVRSALYTMLYEAYTGNVAANYDGSIWEWSSDPEMPLLRDEK